MVPNIAANEVWKLLTAWGSGLTTLAIVGLVGLLCFRVCKAWRLRRASRNLLEAANHAVHRLMNAVRAMLEPVLQREYELWEHEQVLSLRQHQGKGLCSERQVDHFEILISSVEVGGSVAKGKIAEKVKRLKDIARELEEKANVVSPF